MADCGAGALCEAVGEVMHAFGQAPGVAHLVSSGLLADAVAAVDATLPARRKGGTPLQPAVSAAGTRAPGGIRAGTGWAAWALLDAGLRASWTDGP